MSDDWEHLRRKQEARTGWASGGGWEMTEPEVHEALRVSGIGTPAGQGLYPVIVGEGMKHIVAVVDAHLDDAVAEPYQDQPLAQDWARVAKLAEELGEVREATRGKALSAADSERIAALEAPIGRAIRALIAVTGQNPRKGVHGTLNDLLDELGDVACCALFAIQHFTQDAETTAGVVEAALVKALNRVTGATTGPRITPGPTRE